MARLVDATGDRQQDAVAQASAALTGGGLVVVPTDTVYGVAADAFSPAATARVFAAKQRSRRLPLPVLIRAEQLDGLAADLPASASRLIDAYWPGPLTVVVPCQPDLTWDIGDNEATVAVRMPQDEVALAVILAVGPLAVTSANRSGRPAATTAEAARDELGDQVELYLDAGPRTQTQPSVIVDLTRDEPLLLRDGDLPADEVLAVARGERPRSTRRRPSADTGGD